MRVSGPLATQREQLLALLWLQARQQRREAQAGGQA